MSKVKLKGLGSLLTLLVFLVSMIFALHFLAVFGIFLIIAYLLWWFIAPRKSLCFLCQTKNDGETCPFCRQKVNTQDGRSPKNLKSLILNGLLLVFFTMISFVVVLAESKILSKLGYPLTSKTVNFAIPTKGQYHLGEVFPLKIEITGIKIPINAVQADVSFDPDILEVVDISTQESFTNIFIQKEIDNSLGYARLTGGLPNPGFQGDKGTFGTIYFRGKGLGAVNIEFLPSSMVLANNGQGTNVLAGLSSVSYLILPKGSQVTTGGSSSLDNSKVLGNITNENQMIFYNEKHVLGTETNPPIEIKDPTEPVNKPLELLANFDRFIITYWQKVIEVLFTEH